VKPFNPIATEAGDLKASRMGVITDSQVADLQRLGVNPVTNRSAGGISNIGTAIAGGVALTGIALATELAHLTSRGSGSGSSNQNNGSQQCGTGATGTIFESTEGGLYLYLPMHTQAGQCVATGAVADLNPAAYTGPRRDGHPDPAGWDDLVGPRARGHLIAHALGGSDVFCRISSRWQQMRTL
jgi:hypothetical protein